MAKFLKTTALSLSLCVAFVSYAHAEDTTGGTVLKKENGVTVKSGTPPMPGTKPSADDLKVNQEPFKFNSPILPADTIKKEEPKKAEEKKPAAKATDKKDDKITIPPRPKAVSHPIVNGKPTPIESLPKEIQPLSTSPRKPEPAVKEVLNKPVEKPSVSSHKLESKDDDLEEQLKTLKDTDIGDSGLPIPRFVTLKSGEVNARTGPGENYPIRWVYQRKNLPVEVTAEFKMWRRIKDFDGEQTWVHQALLAGKRYAIIEKGADAYSDYEDGQVVARFKRGVQVKINECKRSQCYVEYGSVEGWIEKKNLWGVYSKEEFD